MKWLNKLPSVETCCGCIRLKIGCYIVAFTTIIFATMVPSLSAEVYRCYDFKLTSVKIVIFTTSAMYVFSIGVSIYFLYGLCSKKSDHPIMVMMFMIMKAMILTIIVALVVFFETPKKKLCPDGFILGTTTSLSLCIQAYSLLIVNSFRLEEGIGVDDDNE